MWLMKLTKKKKKKKIKFIWSELIETRPTIAIFEFLKIREPLCVFLYCDQIGSYGICLNLSKISIQPMYVFFAELHPPLFLAKTEL